MNTSTTEATVLRDRVTADPPSPKAKPRQTLGRMLHYMTLERGLFWSMIVLLFISQGLKVALPVLIGRAIDIISGAAGGPATGSSRGTLQDLLVVVLVIVAVGLGIVLFSYFRDRVVAILAEKASYHLRTELFNHIQSLSLSFFDRQPIGELMSNVTNDIGVVNAFYTNGVSRILRATLIILMTVVVMFILNISLTVTVLVVIPLMLLLVGALGRVAGPAFARLQEQLGATNGYMEETISGGKTIIAYRQQQQVGDFLEKHSNTVRDTGARAQFTALLATPVMGVVNNIQTALVALVGSIMAIEGAFGFGTVVIFLTYAMQLQDPIQELGQIYNSFLAAMAGADRVFSILDEEPSVKDRPDAVQLQPIEGLVHFEHVDFSYLPGRRVLRDNSFEAFPGQMIGLVGPTGAGKSTIMNILTRYYDLDRGSISIDGQEISSLFQESLRRQVGVVLQEAFLFSATVMENLRYARENATDQECITAAKEANADDFIMQLPQGYNTLLTERGANLSQGQRQMITIARAMVANPRMLILDEATSNVDTRTEKLIQEGLHRLMEGRTSFVIAHRLSTVRKAAVILVIKEGEIIERGSHEELMARQGFYYDLYMSQFKGALAKGK